MPWLTIVFLHNTLTVVAQEELVLLGKLLGGKGKASINELTLSDAQRAGDSTQCQATSIGGAWSILGSA